MHSVQMTLAYMLFWRVVVWCDSKLFNQVTFSHHGECLIKVHRYYNKNAFEDHRNNHVISINWLSYLVNYIHCGLYTHQQESMSRQICWWNTYIRKIGNMLSSANLLNVTLSNQFVWLSHNTIMSYLDAKVIVDWRSTSMRNNSWP